MEQITRVTIPLQATFGMLDEMHNQVIPGILALHNGVRLNQVSPLNPEFKAMCSSYHAIVFHSIWS